MAHITHKDLDKLAQLSRITINDQEAEQISSKIEKLLQYTEGLASVAATADNNYTLPQRRNIVRKDVAVSTDPEPIIAQSAHHEHKFFVVPIIIADSDTDSDIHE